MIGLLVATIGACAGYLEAWPINPARDLGPRVFCFLFGWGAQAFPAPQHYWWVPIAGPLLGGAAGGGLYQLAVRPYLPQRAPAERAREPAATSWRSIRARPRRAPSCSTSRRSTVALARREFAQHYPASGWVEHDPEDIWRDTLTVVREAIGRAGVGGRARSRPSASPISARPWCCGSAPAGQPIHRAIVWQDRRTAEVCAQLKAAGAEPEVRRKTGLLLDPYFSGTKVAWILDHVPGARARAERGELAFGTIDSFLLWRLTGGRVHATDVTNASRTLLYDIHAQALGRGAAAPAARAARAPAAGARQQRGVRHHRARALRARAADRRHRRRPAGRALRPGVLRPGDGQVHLRHRLLPAAQHRARSPSPPRTAC